jgi:nickel/cobalt exporter
MFISGKQPVTRFAAALAVGAFLTLATALALAQASHPFGMPESGAKMAGSGAIANFFGHVAAWQAHFYRQLTGAVRAWQAQDGAAWRLIGLSFAYGVLHALGPGHGKAVISSYVLANRQTVRNGALLALLSALLQALVAIALVALLGLVLNTTAAVMNLATAWLERVAYGLVTLLGAWLIWIKVICPLRPRNRGAHAAPVHTHDASPHSGAACGSCGHVPLLTTVQGELNLRHAALAVVAVGLRPCSGALIVLVFALSQGFFTAGMAAAFAMALGTGLTVAALASLAALAAKMVTRLGNRSAPAWAVRLHYGLQALAACMVFLLGVLLLGGQWAAAQMGAVS